MTSPIDIVKVAYKVLFSLEIELVGYQDIATFNITIVPDPTTEELYTKYKILSKKRNATNVLLIQTQPDGVDKGKPEIMINNNELFRFQVKVDRTFLQGTHLANYNFTDNVLYASNSANNVIGTDVLLSRPLQIYNASSAYETGYMARSGSRNYKAIQPSNSGSPHGVTDTLYWKEITSPAFISQVDLQTRASLTKATNLDTIIVVEIFHSGTLSTDYKLLDGSLKCREVIYKIRLHT